MSFHRVQNFPTVLSADIRLRALHETCHAVRAIQLGGVVDVITLDRCVASGLRRDKDHLQYRIAGLCAEFTFGYRQRLPPDIEVYEEALWAVRSCEIDPAHDLESFFSILTRHLPSLTDNELMVHADLQIAECHQELRHPDWLPVIERGAGILLDRKQCSGDDFCRSLME